MRMPRNPRARQRLIRKLRKAIHAQIEFWDLMSAIAEITAADPDRVLEFCQATAITADTGMELGETDLQDLLDCLAGTLTAKTWRAKPLKND